MAPQIIYAAGVYAGPAWLGSWRDSAVRFTITGVVEEKETSRPLRDLIVRAFDKDRFFDDMVGYGTTDVEGRFLIRFGVEAFRDVWETRPDLYLRILDKDGIRILHETAEAIRWNAAETEHFQVRIPARALDPRGSRA